MFSPRRRSPTQTWSDTQSYEFFNPGVGDLRESVPIADPALNRSLKGVQKLGFLWRPTVLATAFSTCRLATHCNASEEPRLEISLRAFLFTMTPSLLSTHALEFVAVFNSCQRGDLPSLLPAIAKLSASPRHLQTTGADLSAGLRAPGWHY